MAVENEAELEQPSLGEVPEQEAAPVEEVVEKETPAADEKPEAVEAEKPSATDTTHLVAEAGVSPKEMSEQLAEHGELTPAMMKALVTTHGEAVAKLIVDSVKSIQSEAKSRVEATNNEIFGEMESNFGLEKGQGKEAFKELGAWARENAEPEELDGLNKMLNAGGFQAKLAIQTLAEAYKTSSDYTQEAELTEGDSSAGAVGEPLSASDYTNELDKLLSAGHGYESKKVEDLKRRRAQSRARGY